MGSVDQPTPALNATYPTRCLEFLHREAKTSQNGATGAETSQAKVLLNVVIVGAGLGGLATALALARQGHKVVVLEQAHALEEVQYSLLSRLAFRYCANVVKGRRWHSNSIQLKSNIVKMGSRTPPQG
jgi:hypothetical protein